MSPQRLIHESLSDSPTKETDPAQFIDSGAELFTNLGIVPMSLHEAVAQLVPELTGYFYRRLNNIDDASDAAGDTVLILLNKGSKIPHEVEHMRQYAYGIARKVLVKTRRGRVKRSDIATRLSHELKAFALPPADPNLPLERALAELSNLDRELILLVAWEGFGVAQAGAVLGLRPAAARKRYSRVRARLRSQLDA